MISTILLAGYGKPFGPKNNLHLTSDERLIAGIAIFGDSFVQNSQITLQKSHGMDFLKFVKLSSIKHYD